MTVLQEPEAAAPSTAPVPKSPNPFSALDAAVPYESTLHYVSSGARATASAQHVLTEASLPAPRLSPAQLALLANSLPPDERCWLIEGLCRELRNANERIAALTEWLENDRPLPAGIDWEWTGDQEE